MADANWRRIRVVDCELSVKTRNSLAHDHGPNVTLGQIAIKSDVDLVRSANVGRRTVREIREMIEIMKAAHPDRVEPPIFHPNVVIEWDLLGKALAFYQSKGFTYVEAPWAVDDATVEITAAPEEWRAPGRMGLGTLVGSAEQSFLHLARRGKLKPGRYVACTPCFRPAEIVDETHWPYFMKIELIDLHPPCAPTEFQVEINDEGAAIKLGQHITGVIHMLQCAGECFRDLGATPDMLATLQTEQGVDIMLNGHEVGSYGLRAHEYEDGSIVEWTYGTGLALPRFSQALAA